MNEQNVKTLPADIFSRVDRLAATRLVEYWEQDPCNPNIYYGEELLASVDVGSTYESEEVTIAENMVQKSNRVSAWVNTTYSL